METNTYKEVKEVQIGNCIVCVYVPEITEDERKRRERNLATTLRIVGKELAQKGVI